MKTEVWNCGGGTQSIAIAALIKLGRLVKPDLAIIVDTGREKSSTWEYFDLILKPEMAEIGLEIHRVGKEEYATVDLYSHKSGDLLIPAFTNQSGNVGKLQTFCSTEWKRRVSMRWLRQRGVSECIAWIGISVDEMHRVRVSREQWYQHRYPLIEQRMRRHDCYQIIESVGWPEPPRSSCWMCPNMADAEWREMRQCRQKDFLLAVAFEKELQREDPNVYLHRSCKPLDQVDFDYIDQQGDLFKDNSCSSGYCFV